MIICLMFVIAFPACLQIKHCGMLTAFLIRNHSVVDLETQHPVMPEAVRSRDSGQLQRERQGPPSSAYILFQPHDPADKWNILKIGSIEPDLLVSVSLADIDGDGDKDLFSGSYSLGSRDKDDSDGLNKSFGSVVWFENTENNWIKNNILRRKRGMYDKWIPLDLDKDSDLDFIGTRGNSCLLYTSPSPRDMRRSRMPSSA